MKTRTLKVSFLTAAMLMGASTVQAGHPDSDNLLIRARVISSTPIYNTINEPHRECWTETTGYETRTYRNNNNGGTIIGAIAGGLLGSTVGKGNGRVAAAAVGAATGAVVGGRWNDGTRHESYPTQVERCRTIDHVRQVVEAYDVRYRFQGRVYHTRLPYDPGNWVNLNANFSVAENQDYRRARYSQNQWNDNDRWNEGDRRYDD